MSSQLHLPGASISKTADNEIEAACWWYINLHKLHLWFYSLCIRCDLLVDLIVPTLGSGNVQACGYVLKVGRPM